MANHYFLSKGKNNLSLLFRFCDIF